MGWMDLLPEEAYYWNYSQHLDIGYLDHPPMVAWLIWLSTSVLGDTEFAVRLPAFIGWFAFAFFSFRFCSNLFGRKAAYWMLALISILPIYFSIGFMMTPDAPMYIAWSACLYFLERALIAKKQTAWWGIGISLGLGLLSKYSIGLLGLVTVVFLLLERESRFWWKRPEPYLAALLALCLFIPVLIWNYRNDWASFVFQSSRRWTGGYHFSLHLLVGGIIILLTPTGIVAIVRALIKKITIDQTSYGAYQSVRRKRLFALVFTFIPLLIFTIFSLRREPKLNWTGPVWLAILPLLALDLKNVAGVYTKNSGALKKAWLVTFSALTVFYISGISYISLGMPGLSTTGFPLPTAWKEFYNRVESIESNLESKTRQEPLVVGMDKYWISSELAFYGAGDKDSLYEYGGRNLFDEIDLMWNFWVPKREILGKNLIIISFDKNDLEKPIVVTSFDEVGPIGIEPVHKCDIIASRFYWRIGYRYKGCILENI